MLHFNVIEHTVPCYPIRERPGAVEPGQGANLRLAVKQYIPKNNPQPSPGDVTLIGAHANSFPKEVYEPLWDDLYEHMNSLQRRIRSIWIADVSHQGQSSVLNERILGDDPSWMDHARDLLGLVYRYQNDMPHPIIGIGHSMGGVQLAHLALLHPSLFQSLIVIDSPLRRENPSKKYALGSTNRRDLWPSREEAINKFRGNKVFKDFDARSFDRFVEYGLRDLPTELYPDENRDTTPVTLTTTKAQELYTYLRPTYQDGKVGLKEGEWRQEMHPEDREEGYPFYRPEPVSIFRQLPQLRPSVLYVFGERSEITTLPVRREMLEMTGCGVGGSGGVQRARVKEVVLPTGHLVPMENPRKCALVSAAFCDSELSRWENDQREFMQKWTAKPRAGKIVVDEKWKENIGSVPVKPKI
ncbi:Alpha/beta hydrolase family-domain-containing protein [Aspergillus bertholletiae]|uniref:Alpha/beta hydrolase family-domain-containing protein n=1 Tax=Aspergillus bertholletiae TaxID=1226010 RepID=A0A5N7B730_9EURO|nr:Alpha/beta hydrolase family-domain-containing protein [Aspergillus bertholletiae]